jgi:Hemerythrin HHE cation binding domain
MSVDLQPDLRPSYLEHRAMRMAAERLPSIVSSARPADAERLTALASWYAGHEGAIHDHHTAEEAVSYPALLERDPSYADADGELEGEHRVLADRLAVTREGRTAWKVVGARAFVSPVRGCSTTPHPPNTPTC